MALAGGNELKSFYLCVLSISDEWLLIVEPVSDIII